MPIKVHQAGATFRLWGFDMKKQAISRQLLALVAVTAMGTAGSSEASTARDGSEAVESTTGSPPAISTFFRDSPATDDATFEYQLHPFSRFNFDGRAEFEQWMDDLGALGFASVIHFANDLFDPTDDTRVAKSRSAISRARSLSRSPA